MPIISRRATLKGLGGSLLLAWSPRFSFAQVPRFRANPFRLGIASGSPTASEVILWTRLLDQELLSQPVPVRWEVASDEHMRKVVQRGTFIATAEWGHSVHLEIDKLHSSRDYWYRFYAGDYASSIGRTRTMPSAGENPKRMRVAIASCQKFENGFYTAYQHMLAEHADLIMHVGDYIYEGTGGNGLVRGDGSGEVFTLDQYRARYALYKTDPDLQAVHAAHPWLVTWDDHEVANDYAGDTSYDQSGEEFLRRRAAAYRAYYENMPLRRSAIPVGPNMRLFASSAFGNLVNVHMLDSRQHRSPLGCLGDGETEGPGASCKTLFDTQRTKLGREQETWLAGELSKSTARWNVMACGTPMAHVDLDPGPGVAYRRDSWDGYPAARQRFLDTLATVRPNNPVVVNGDIHAFQVANLNRQAHNLDTPVIASEFTATSITSPGVSQRALQDRRSWNPNVLLSDATRHGYLLLDFKREELGAELVTVETVREQRAARGVMARFVVENGTPGPKQA